MGKFFFLYIYSQGSVKFPPPHRRSKLALLPWPVQTTQHEEPGRKDEETQAPIFLKPQSNQSPPQVPTVAEGGSDEQRAGKAQRKQGMPPSVSMRRPGWPGDRKPEEGQGQPSACSSTPPGSFPGSSSPGQKGMVFLGQEGRRQEKHKASSGAPKGQDGPSGHLSVCSCLAGVSTQGTRPSAGTAVG